jgi:endonuclease/exonuclease/phosphatase family metal-dependent hydrolase
MTPRRQTLWLLALAGFAAACGDDAPEDTADASTGTDAGSDAGSAPSGPARFDVITFNMALTTTVKGPDERRPGIMEALAAEDADVLCLQEGFEGVASPEQVADELADAYPHAYWSTLPNETALGSGVLLLSKHPLHNTEALRFVAEDLFGFVDRTALVAEVALGGMHLRVACVHLTAGLGSGGLMRRQAQIAETIDWLDGLPAVDGPTFLLGDFNAGPDPIGACTPSTDPSCEPADVASYEQVLEHFDDPNVDFDECTQCKEQFDSLQTIAIFSTEPDQRIDHCFVRDLAPLVHLDSQIVLGDEVALPFEDETLEHLSDHRGVRCNFGSGD